MHFLIVLALLLQVQPANRDTRVTWDPVTTDIAGNPETIDRYELVVVPADAVVTDTVPKLLVTGGGLEGAIGIHMLSRSFVAGNYDVRVRAVDKAQNAGEWSDPLELAWPDLIPPDKVRNFRLLLEVGDVRIEAAGTITGI